MGQKPGTKATLKGGLARLPLIMDISAMEMPDMPSIASAAHTHTGTVRHYNEDNMLSRPALGLWAVADGAGGHQSGDVASAMIVNELAQLPEFLSADDLLLEVRRTIVRVHRALRREAATRGNDTIIASTFVALILRNGRYTCLWAGDSRAYMLRQGELNQLSRDHSLVQELVDLGKISADEAETHPHANIITRAVGADSDQLELDTATGSTRPGDKFLLCSDGLSKTLPAAQINELLDKADMEKAAQGLVAAALAKMVRDNVTAVTISV